MEQVCSDLGYSQESTRGRTLFAFSCMHRPAKAEKSIFQDVLSAWRHGIRGASLPSGAIAFSGGVNSAGQTTTNVCSVRCVRNMFLLLVCRALRISVSTLLSFSSYFKVGVASVDDFRSTSTQANPTSGRLGLCRGRSTTMRLWASATRTGSSAANSAVIRSTRKSSASLPLPQFKTSATCRRFFFFGD